MCDLNASASGEDGDYLNLLAAPDDAPSEIPADLWERIGPPVLTARQHECVVLRFRDGLTLQEIARRLGVSKERARQVVLGAVKKLSEAPELQGLAEVV